jgi:hypothetical protein
MLLIPAALAAATSPPAEAALIAGWDFTQYDSGGGSLTVGGAPGNVLGANYTAPELDPAGLVPGLGVAAAPFGTMYANGAFGSTNASNSGPLIPVVDSLTLNLNAPDPNEFDSLTSLVFFGGQASAEYFKMQANGALSVVFEANLASRPEIGQDWQLSFALQGANGQTVSIELSTDGGVSFNPLSPVVLTNANETLVQRALGGAGSTYDSVLVRVGLPQGSWFDNVALSAAIVAPEPGTALLLLAGLSGLAAIGRSRASR